MTGNFYRAPHSNQKIISHFRLSSKPFDPSINRNHVAGTNGNKYYYDIEEQIRRTRTVKETTAEDALMTLICISLFSEEKEGWKTP